MTFDRKVYMANRASSKKLEKHTSDLENIIARLKVMILDYDGLGDVGKGKYEYKRFEVKYESWGTFVIAEVGLIGDEGTVASVLCRTHRHIWIPNPKRGAKQWDRMVLLSAIDPEGKPLPDYKRPKGTAVTYSLSK